MVDAYYLLGAVALLYVAVLIFFFAHLIGQVVRHIDTKKRLSLPWMRR